MSTATKPSFNYESFDRQMEGFLSMSYLMIDEWDECTSEEMTSDLYSLCIKGARLCNMIDADLALQQQDLTQSRHGKNQDYYLRLNEIMRPLSELIFKAMDEMKQQKTLKRLGASEVQMDFSLLMPKLQDLLSPTTEENARSKEAFALLPMLFNAIENELGLMSISQLPWELSVLNLFKYFASICLLLFHFQSLAKMTDEEVNSEEAGRILTGLVQGYVDSEKGQEELRKFIAVMKYEHDGQSLSATELMAERRQLIKLVPSAFQTCFMENIDDMSALAMSIVSIRPLPNEDDFETLLSVVAKYQWISERLYEHDHPESISPEIFNEVFHTSKNGKPVNMKRLRKVIEKMIGMIDKKNHWFCIYSVLKYRNYIKDPVATHFAQQMQHHDWFPNLPKHLHFSGETLTEYNGYLNDNTYPTWNKERYEIFRLGKGKKKWSPTLWLKFQRLCYELDECLVDSKPDRW